MEKVTLEELRWCLENLTAEEDYRLQELLPSIREDRKARILAALMYLKINETLRSKGLEEMPSNALVQENLLSDPAYVTAKNALVEEGLLYQPIEGYLGLTPSPYPY